MEEHNIRIRRATPEDAGYLVKLNEEFNGVTVPVHEAKEILQSTTELVALAIMNDIPVGFGCAQYFRSFCYRGLQGEITELYITNDARRKGVATLLITYIEEELKQLGVSSVKVLTGKNNDIAIKTYEKSRYVLKEEVLLKKRI